MDKAVVDPAIKSNLDKINSEIHSACQGLDFDLAVKKQTKASVLNVLFCLLWIFSELGVHLNIKKLAPPEAGPPVGQGGVPTTPVTKPTAPLPVPQQISSPNTSSTTPAQPSIRNSPGSQTTPSTSPAQATLSQTQSQTQRQQPVISPKQVTAQGTQASPVSQRLTSPSAPVSLIGISPLAPAPAQQQAQSSVPGIIDLVSFFSLFFFSFFFFFFKWLFFI